MFQLNKEEYDDMKLKNGIEVYNESLRFQNGTIEKGRGKHRKYLPYAFTEQGVAMLSAVLRSKTAVNVSIHVIDAFVAMRRFFTLNAQVFQRLDSLEIKQHETNKKIENLLVAIETRELQPKQGIFFNGQVFDAYEFVSRLIKKANRSIILIDNYIDESVLLLLSKKKNDVNVIILTRKIQKVLAQDIDKFNQQYQNVEIREFKESHDRFLILDDEEIYHIGASLKDLGKKWFAFSRMDACSLDILSKVCDQIELG